MEEVSGRRGEITLREVEDLEKIGAVKIEVLSYLMNQSHSNDQEVWFSLACDLCTAVYNTISIHSQPVINVLLGPQQQYRGRDVCGVFAVACL